LGFSPLWLFIQQPWTDRDSRLEELMLRGNLELSQSAQSVYEFLFSRFRKDPPPTNQESWVRETILVAQALSAAVNGSSIPNEPEFERASKLAKSICQALGELPFRPEGLTGWPQDPVEVGSTGESPAVQSLQTHSQGPGPESPLACATAFVDSYNLVLRAQESITLMETAARCLGDSPMLDIIASALLHHVVLERDVPFKRAVTWLENSTGGKQTGYKDLIAVALGLLEMRPFTQVLKPILHAWRLL